MHEVSWFFLALLPSGNSVFICALCVTVAATGLWWSDHRSQRRRCCQETPCLFFDVACIRTRGCRAIYFRYYS